MRRRGFSMVELIVVMGIVALLAALLFPVLVATKAKAGETVCMSNLRQLGAAMLMYKDEEGEFPWGQPSAFDHYLGNAKLRCPQKHSEYAYNFGVYENNAVFGMPIREGDKEGKRHVDATRECLERRGPQFPLLLDLNHLPKILVAGSEPRSGTALVFRLSGAVERIPGSRVAEINLASSGIPSRTPIHLPCSSDAQDSNL